MELFKSSATAADAVEAYQQVQANCRYDAKRCIRYGVPVNAATMGNIYFFTWLPDKVPTDIEFKMHDSCDGVTVSAFTPVSYLIGVDALGSRYLVVKGIPALLYDRFVIQAKVTYDDATFDYFSSQEFQSETCQPVGMVYASYSSAANGGYDANGFYHGLPATVIVGNSNLRYRHNFTARDLNVLASGKKMTFTSLNNNPVKNTTDTTYAFTHEAIPSWYEEITSQAFALGTVIFDGLTYKISDYSSAPVGDIVCERMSCKAVATKVRNVTFGCVADEEVPESTLPTISIDNASQCPDEPIDVTIAVSGTSPITATVLDDAGLSVIISGTMFGGDLNAESIQISGAFIGGEVVQIELANSIGTVTKTFTITALPCCNLGDLSYIVV